RANEHANWRRLPHAEEGAARRRGGAGHAGARNGCGVVRSVGRPLARGEASIGPRAAGAGWAAPARCGVSRAAYPREIVPCTDGARVAVAWSPWIWVDRQRAVAPLFVRAGVTDAALTQTATRINHRRPGARNPGIERPRPARPS